jgi:hypothetical protein
MARRPRRNVAPAPKPVPRASVAAYRPGTHCPGCSHSNWLVGRITAECAFCGTALPRAEAVHG